MKVHFVGAGPGDPDLLTVKALRLINKCRICIYAGSLVSPKILALLNDSCEKHDSSYMTLESIISVINAAHIRDISVVRLHTGDPSLYGAIREQMVWLDRMEIEYDVTPGISSFLAAAATVRTELTVPEIAQTVILSRIGGRTPVPESQTLEKLAATKGTLCLFLSIHDIRSIVETVLPFYGQKCPVAVVYHASWDDEQVIIGTLETIVEKVECVGIAKTAIIMIGQALGKDDRRSLLYDEKYTHGFRQGTCE